MYQWEMSHPSRRLRSIRRNRLQTGTLFQCQHSLRRKIIFDLMSMDPSAHRRGPVHASPFDPYGTAAESCSLSSSWPIGNRLELDRSGHRFGIIEACAVALRAGDRFDRRTRGYGQRRRLRGRAVLAAARHSTFKTIPTCSVPFDQ